MLDFQSISSPAGAFFAGLVTSLHCSVMCGPLACYLTNTKGGNYSPSTLAAYYHISRILSYTLVGSLAGGLGLIALGWVNIYQESIARFFPWALALFFLLVATRFDRHFPKPTFLANQIVRLRGKANQLPKPIAACGIGALTPLLPCAPLYAIFTLALMTQSPIHGAEFLLSFALGTLPLLWLAQISYQKWNQRLNPTMLQRIQRALAFIIFVILAIRLYIFETGQNGLFCTTP